MSRGHGVFDTPHVWMPEGCLDAWHTAKAGSAGSQVPVVILGDSIAQGYNATSFNRTSWEAVVRIALQARYGEAGRYFGVSDSVKLTPFIVAGDVAWTLPAAGWTNFSMLGFQGYLLGANGDAATFAPPGAYAFVDFDLKVSQAPDGSTATLTVDTVGQTAPTYFNAGYLHHVTFQYTGFASATHTVVVTQTQAAKVAYLAGAVCYPRGRGASGLLWVREALQGSTSLIAMPQYPTQQAAYLGSKGSIEDWAPKLVVVALGVNVCQNWVGVEQFAWNLAQLAQSAQNAGSSLVVLMSYGASSFTNAAAYGQYVAAAREVAHSFNAAFVNAHSAFGAAAGLIGSGGHPNDAGHALMANLLLGIL